MEANREMVTSLKIKGMHEVRLSDSTLVLDEVKIPLKNIPFVRYDFDRYGEAEAEYIMKSMEKFTYSTHMVQFHLNDALRESLSIVVDKLGSKVCKYLYIDIHTGDIADESMREELAAQAVEAMGLADFDRVMLVDKTTDLNMLNARGAMNKFAKRAGMKPDSIGICSSPWCLQGGIACLTAQRARELAAKYSGSIETAVPSANHECMNECGCIRYIEVTSDIGRVKEHRKAKSKAEEKEKVSSDRKDDDKSSGSSQKKQKSTKIGGVQMYNSMF